MKASGRDESTNAFQFMKSLVILALFTCHAIALAEESASWENPLREKLAKMAADLTANLKPWDVPNRRFEVENYSAVADGVTLNTSAIQKTFDECSNAGGSMVVFSNERISGSGNFRQGSFISGIKDGVIEDVVIRNYQVGMASGGSTEMMQAPVAESEKGYPYAHQFSVKGLPAMVFYIRHARRIDFREANVTPATSDARPAFVLGAGAQDVRFDGEAMANWAF